MDFYTLWVSCKGSLSALIFKSIEKTPQAMRYQALAGFSSLFWNSLSRLKNSLLIHFAPLLHIPSNRWNLWVFWVLWTKGIDTYCVTGYTIIILFCRAD